MEERVTEEYSYDKNGNRLTAVVDGSQTVSTYDAQDKMLSYGDNIYSYSPTGSLLTKTNAEGTTTYSYDSMGNLLKVVLPDNRVITYKVDARGRRIGKSIDGVFQYGFVYGDQLNPIAKVDEEGNIIESYVYGLKSNIPEYVVKDNVKYKIISDHLGSPLAIWQEGENTSPVLEIKYNSFGNILEQNGDFELPFRFASGIWDEDTKLIRFGVRDYDPETGRWTSVEPLGFAGSRNWYVYAGNDGVNYLDLDGLRYRGWGNWDKNGNHVKLGHIGNSSLGILSNTIFSRFVKHYFNGNGKPVNLRDWGLGKKFENTKSVKKEVNDFMDEVKNGDFNSMCIEIDSTTNVTWDGELFSVGGSSFFRYADCENGVCIGHFKIMDKFADPLDIGIELPFSKKYNINYEFMIIFNY